MTIPNETMPTIDAVVADLWRSLLGAAFGALRASFRARLR